MSEATSPKPMPPPPEDSIDPERVAGAEERWQECPLKDCKRDPELLYADFYLRDMRTNRLMCNACTVRTDAGYMAREVVRAHDDRFFQGNLGTDGIVFGVMLIGSIIANVLAILVGFFYFAFFIGSGIGGMIAYQARKLSGKRVTRQSHYYGTGGIVVGALLAPTIYILLRTGLVVFNLQAALTDFSILACSAGMVMASWGVFLRRI